VDLRAIAATAAALCCRCEPHLQDRRQAMSHHGDRAPVVKASELGQYASHAAGHSDVGLTAVAGLRVGSLGPAGRGADSPQSPQHKSLLPCTKCGILGPSSLWLPNRAPGATLGEGDGKPNVQTTAKAREIWGSGILVLELGRGGSSSSGANPNSSRLPARTFSSIASPAARRVAPWVSPLS
jgi:hypothetical protein